MGEFEEEEESGRGQMPGLKLKQRSEYKEDLRARWEKEKG